MYLSATSGPSTKVCVEMCSRFCVVANDSNEEICDSKGNANNFHPQAKNSLLHLTHFWFILEIGPASVMVGNLVSGKRIAQASGRDLGQIEDNDQARKVS